MNRNFISVAWTGLASLAAVVALQGCAVDVNEAEDGTVAPPRPADCESAKTSRVRFFHGIVQVPAQAEAGKPALFPGVTVQITKGADDPRTLASVTYGRARSAAVCSGISYKLEFILQDKDETVLATIADFTVTDKLPETVIATGFAAPVADAIPAQDAVRVIRIPEVDYTVAPDGKVRLRLVHAAPDAPPVSVTTPTIPETARYGVTEEIVVDGDVAFAPKLVSGAVTAASFSVTRIPAKAALIGIVYGTLNKADDAPVSPGAGRKIAAPLTLFLTGTDPLFGNTLPGGFPVVAVLP